ncbi:MAG: M3 family oligoendopeptidase [Defluviitaleaceae bacterium]|nr:M3 family oligoendopeptidase [Defluviitaleaceae bacterium]
MKFSQMEYQRPELAQVQATIQDHLAKFNAAKTAQEAIDAYIAFDEYASTQVYHFISLAHIRKSLDTNDQFYKDEVDFWNNAGPVLQKDRQAFVQALLQSPFRKDLEAAWGDVMFVNAEMQLKTFSPEIVEDLQAENALSTEYTQLRASAQISYDGKTLTLAEFGSYFENPDPAVRRSARDAVAGWWAENADKMDEIYDKMVAVRTKIAKTLGYDNYIQLAYYRRGRNCYDAKMVDKFREGIRSHIVPLVSRFKVEQATRIGVDKISLYDNAFSYPDGNPMPIGTPDEIMAHGRKMYKDMGPDTADFIDILMDNELFDVVTRPGKQGGGYCSYLPAYKMPFVFANFNGTAGDVDVLTHEVGHALAAYEARNIQPTDLAEYSFDTAEIHSMAMEFFAWPWMEGFFGDQTEKYYDSHISDSVTFLPYGTMVDHFQHWVYENYNATPAERHAQWAKLEAQYRPFLNYDGIEFYQDGRWWQNQAHIYTAPFYYIDYVLAQLMAIKFWAEAQEDKKAAWDKYMKLLRAAGTKTFLGLIEEAGLPTPFEPQNIKAIADAVTAWLGNRK